MSILNISSASGLSRVVRGPGGSSLSLWAFFDLLRRVRRPAPGLCSLGCRNTPLLERQVSSSSNRLIMRLRPLRSWLGLGTPI